jgi:hypothetical protein
MKKNVYMCVAWCVLMSLWLMLYSRHTIRCRNSLDE